MITPETVDLIRAYKERKYGWPNGGSFWEQPAVFCEAVKTIEDVQSQLEAFRKKKGGGGS